MMNRYLQFTILLTLSFGTYSQTTIPSKKVIKKAKADTSFNTSMLFSDHKTWELVTFYDYKANEYNLLDSSRTIKYVDDNTVNYITPNDKFEIIDTRKFEIVYGGSGPERVTYEVIKRIGDYLILESKFTNKGYFNGKLVWKQKMKVRYVWKPKV